jgi:CRISPR/Cas system-associated exonuclease Cas4 (RecB family)
LVLPKSSELGFDKRESIGLQLSPTGRVAEAVDELMEEPGLLPGHEPWPTDRVQLGLQVLLLEEAGYTVPEAYLYYAAERIRLRVEVDDALRRDALAEL